MWIAARAVVMMTAVALLLPAAARAETVGHRDFAFTAASVAKPSGEKPQSKLWYVDGTWWGSLFDAQAEEYHVYRFDPAAQAWEDTGTALDARNSSHGDALWDGTHLYLASAAATADVRVFRLSYEAAARRWTVDAGWPQTIPATPPVEAVVIDKDATGRLWLTFTEDNASGGRHVQVTSRTPADPWSAPFTLPVANANDLSADDISSVVRYPGGIGVMWSNQTAGAIYFAAHADGDADHAWTRSTAIDGAFSADDHLNLKSVQADTGGRVFAAVKTSYGDAPMANPFEPQILLLERSPLGAWSQHRVGSVGDDHTRPIVMTDQRSRRLYVVATSPTVADGRQSIYYKAADLDAPSFTEGLGTKLMGSAAGAIDVNDASSTKQDLAAIPELLVLGSDAANYWHNTIALERPGPEPTATPTVTSTPTVSAASTPAPTAPPSPDTTRPVVTGVRLAPSRFAVVRGRFKPARGRGSLLAFTLSEPGRAVARVDRALPGRRAGRRCVAPGRARAGARACTRYRRVSGSLAQHTTQGTNLIRITGRVSGRALSRGRYRLTLTVADDAGNVSRPRAVTFTILRARPSAVR